MNSTKFLVHEILADFTDQEIYEKCLKHDIPVSEHDTRERMIEQIVQHCKLERGGGNE